MHSASIGKVKVNVEPAPGIKKTCLSAKDIIALKSKRWILTDIKTILAN